MNETEITPWQQALENSEPFLCIFYPRIRCRIVSHDSSTVVIEQIVRDTSKEGKAICTKYMKWYETEPLKLIEKGFNQDEYLLMDKKIQKRFLRLGIV